MAASRSGSAGGCPYPSRGVLGRSANTSRPRQWPGLSPSRAGRRRPLLPPSLLEHQAAELSEGPQHSDGPFTTEDPCIASVAAMSRDLPELRASHEDRDRVVDTLRTAGGDGRLTAEELDARVERALSARTQGELAIWGIKADDWALTGRLSRRTLRRK